MAENPTPDPVPVSREEFEELKKQLNEIAAFLKEKFKPKQGPQLDDPPNVPPNEEDRVPPKVNQVHHKRTIVGPENEGTDGLHKKLKQMEEAIRSMKGIEAVGSVNYSDLCIFPGARYPEKFKVPEFEKYSGSGDPYTHLKIYIGELGAYAEDESLRMQLFQKSLTGEARTWYARLDNTRIHNWEELAHTFLTQYSFQSQMAPDRYQMTKIRKQSHESFRDYAQRWRRMAAQVNPPMSEAEMVTTFIDIQEAPYYERVMAGIGKPFAEMIRHGEMAEIGLRTGKIKDFTTLDAMVEHLQAKDQDSQGREKNDVSFISRGPSNYFKGNNLELQQQAVFNQGQGRQEKFERAEGRKFTPLGDSLENVLAILVAEGKITELAPPIDPRSKRFNQHKQCAYHSKSLGHDTQDCWSLKHKIQNLIDRGDIIIEQPEQPNVDPSHFSQYDMNEVNMIGAGSSGMDPYCKYIRKIEGYPPKSGANVIEGEYLEEVKIIKQEVLRIRHQLKQLTDLVVHQHELTRQLFTQLTRSQEKEGDKQKSNWSPSQMIQLTKEEQSRLKGSGSRNDKVARRSHQWSVDKHSDECEPSKGKDQATCPRERKFTPLNKSKAEMLHLLISRGNIVKLLPPSDPKSKNYNPTQRCLYHSNSPGHGTEECWSLGHKIQNIIDGGEMTVDIGASIEESMTTDKGIGGPQLTREW